MHLSIQPSLVIIRASHTNLRQRCTNGVHTRIAHACNATRSFYTYCISYKLWYIDILHSSPYDIRYYKVLLFKNETFPWNIQIEFLITRTWKPPREQWPSTKTRKSQQEATLCFRVPYSPLLTDVEFESSRGQRRRAERRARKTKKNMSKRASSAKRTKKMKRPLDKVLRHKWRYLCDRLHPRKLYSPIWSIATIVRNFSHPCSTSGGVGQRIGVAEYMAVEKVCTW